MESQKILEQGLKSEEVIELQKEFGKNELIHEQKDSFFKKILRTIMEPMFLLLIIAAIIYFILGEAIDALIMLSFVIIIISIDVIQEWKTDRTLEALKDLSAPTITVIRDKKEIVIHSSDLVPGDIMIISEGVKIPADGKIIKCNDLCVDESSLTGEAVGVWKTSKNIEEDSHFKNNYVYSGTLVTGGSAYILVDKIGLETEYGKISKNIISAPKELTPLQKQIGSIVKTCALIAGILFLLVTIVTFFNIGDHALKDRIVESILAGITLAMAMIPEEFPVVLTVFLSMGAWRLAKKQSLVKKLPSVETLGSVSVLCVDKTGTITLNEMTVDRIWSINDDINLLVKTMGMACETDAYDPMEKAILNYCNKVGFSKKDLFSGELISEYSFTNQSKMMGHIWKNEKDIVITSKGATESILKICDLTFKEKREINKEIKKMSKKGMRVIAVGIQRLKNEKDIPKDITECNLTFVGLIGLIDPPRTSIKQDIETCYKAGIRVVMITGDNGITASAIASQVGIEHSENIITGHDIDSMDDKELMKAIKETNIFSRVIPEHKMRIVKALKKSGEIVAMTGDGVNDASALKYADIGIAMGKKGSEVSREAADLILLDDNFSTIVDTIKDGRRIYDNIRKSIGYIFTIHIPIALSALLAPLLNINSIGLLFLPLHVVLLELFIDPTCSIVLERQPAEDNIMTRKPRKLKNNILDGYILIKSIIQGLVIFAFSFGIYYITSYQHPEHYELARTMGISVLLLSNLFLVHVNSSHLDSVFYTLTKLIKDKVMWIVSFATIVVMFAIIYTPINNLLKLTHLSFKQLLLVILLAIVSVFWYEIVKFILRKKEQKKSFQS